MSPAVAFACVRVCVCVFVSACISCQHLVQHLRVENKITLRGPRRGLTGSYVLVP